ncbi:uncharacterized protein KY384_006397 [Bacidia gigantensis]|uniref:uncharacterized protein n=1 Tax=Bacidia gigantensis TaxID=2732470 RepID=UPI001D03DECF|nr:uncharacterized protein KY384_006397 [Bacidia gigantensis]KAG8528710.1 hypothetical protein KY384_006397 [Bacidia gigantensis]
MAPQPPRLKVLSVGGNATSAFMSWRLQATNACDVTLVWKNGYDAVSQYGISFKSKLFGNERFKPRHVVRSPDDASGRKGAFDYVLLCVKALPDVYDLASVIESVVTPQHTCILVNTSHTLGIESHIEQRFPTNVVLSLVSGAEIVQLGASEFEHMGATDVWVGPANKNETIPPVIQKDMADALAMTLNTGQVDCQVSENIRQQQFERVIGPIAFHPASVLFETPTHSELIEKVGVRSMVTGIIDELLELATSQGCIFGRDFKQSTIHKMTQPQDSTSIMYQDFAAKRPMEVETYLGSPIQLAQDTNICCPRIETLYALMHHCNIVNQQKPLPTPAPNAGAGPVPPPARTSSNGPPPPRPPMNGGPNGMNGNGARGGRTPSMGGPPMRRGGGPPMNGYPPRHANGYPPRGPSSQLSRRPSFEGEDLGEFSHVVLYGDIPEGGVAPTYGDMSNGAPNPSDLALRERELSLRQRELQLREQEYRMRRGGGRRPTPSRGGFDDDDDDDDFFDPAANGPPMQNVDPEQIDMMSVTSRRNRRMPSHSQIRQNPEGMMGRPGGMRQSYGRGGFNGRNRSSAQLVDSSMPSLHENLLENPMMGYSSNRYGNVDRREMATESRTNSLTAARLSELQGAGNNAGMNGAYPSPSVARRTSQSPGNPFAGSNMRRSSPPEAGYMGPGPMQRNGGPSPPNMRQPVPRHPPGQGNSVAPHQVEQYAGGPVQKTVRSLTGSASASAGSGDSAPADSDPSAHSSQSSLAPRLNNARYPVGQHVGAH